MEVFLAKTAGFCFGVDRAVKTVQRLLSEKGRVYTLGPIIHNPQMVKELEEKGAIAVDAPEQVPTGECLVIRSHGVGGRHDGPHSKARAFLRGCHLSFCEKDSHPCP